MLGIPRLLFVCLFVCLCVRVGFGGFAPKLSGMFGAWDPPSVGGSLPSP